MTSPSLSWRVRALSFALLAGGACSTSDIDLFTETPSSASFAIAGSDAIVGVLDYVVSDSAGRLVRSESVSPDVDGGLRFSLDLPVAQAYSIALSARTSDGQTCAGSAQFDIAPSARVDVDVELQCSGAPGANVIGSLVSCPSVSIAIGPTSLRVGASLVLATRSDAGLASAPTWTASAGEIQTEAGTTRFTCTAPGDVQVRLSVDAGVCSASDAVVVTCTEPSAAAACDGLGSNCHAVEASSAEAHECHELGHAGDEAACAEGRAACIATCGSALCAELASRCHDVDPGSGPLHECHQLGHAADPAACFGRGRECFDLCTRAHAQPVTIQFAAHVGAAPFACGTRYDAVGSSKASVEPQDFRFFVHDIRFIAADQSEVRVEIDDRAPFQARGTALLDFEDATGACLSGDAATNTQVTAQVPPGQYTGIAFRIGVPESANHADPALQPAPLAAGSMTWGWLSGYKFLRAELGAAAGASVLHLGSAACSGDPVAGSVACARANRSEVRLAHFDASSNVIIADLAALFAGVDFSVAGLCHSSGAACAPFFNSLGVDLSSGQGGPGQTVFRVAP
ncbi:MAG: MbnP family copper-binding protein [Deltaproteobacteria bacterium]